MICTEYCSNQQITVLINLHSRHGISLWYSNKVASYLGKSIYTNKKRSTRFSVYIYIYDIKNEMQQDKQKFKMNKKNTKPNIRETHKSTLEITDDPGNENCYKLSKYAVCACSCKLTLLYCQSQLGPALVKLTAVKCFQINITYPCGKSW